MAATKAKQKLTIWTGGVVEGLTRAISGGKQ